MRRNILIDAGIPALYFGGRNEVKPYFDEVLSGRTIGYITAVNLTEFLYQYARVFGWDAATTKSRLLQPHFRVIVADAEIAEDAAHMKLRYSHLSLADCYLLASAEKYGTEVLSTDGGLRSVEGLEIRIIEI